MSTFFTAVGLFNIFVGLMLVAAFLLWGAGIIMWSIRLGVWPSYRDEAFEYMRWAIAILFVLIVLLGVAEFVQDHTALVMFGLGAAFILVIIYAVLYGAANRGRKEEEK